MLCLAVWANILARSLSRHLASEGHDDLDPQPRLQQLLHRSTCILIADLALNSGICSHRYTLGAVTIPSLASVYNEFALKKHMDTSVHLQNFFLYFFG